MRIRRMCLPRVFLQDVFYDTDESSRSDSTPGMCHLSETPTFAFVVCGINNLSIPSTPFYEQCGVCGLSPFRLSPLGASLHLRSLAIPALSSLFRAFPLFRSRPHSVECCLLRKPLPTSAPRATHVRGTETRPSQRGAQGGLFTRTCCRLALIAAARRRLSPLGHPHPREERDSGSLESPQLLPDPVAVQRHAPRTHWERVRSEEPSQTRTCSPSRYLPGGTPHTVVTENPVRIRRHQGVPSASDAARSA